MPVILIGFATLITFGINNSDLMQDHAIKSEAVQATTEIQNTQITDNIYQFLLANIAFYRNDLDIAKNYFKQLLTNTEDPEIAEILTEVAIEAEDYPLSAFAAQKWAELSPNDFHAQLIAIAILLGDNQLLIEKLLAQAIKIDPNKVDTQLSALLAKLSTQHKKSLQLAIKALATKNPNNPITQLCLAQISAQLNDIETAKQATKIALQLKPNLTHAIFLQAKLIRYNTKSDIPALDYLAQQILKFNQNEELHLFYANALLDNNKNLEALNILTKLLNSKNQEISLEANLLTAEIYLQQPNLNIKQAQISLNKLANTNFATSKVNFLLAQIAEQQNDAIEAVRLYTSITEEPYHVIAFLRAALLLSNNHQLDQAIDILNQAEPTTILEKKQLLLFKIELALELRDLSLAITNANQGLDMLPNDIEFLYARSITASLDNKILVAEKDLKHIITIQPENHNALNALGFILTLHTDRQQEAFYYLQQALQLAPENPAYMDNMGLLLYHMGKISDSLHILSQAYKISNNLNIAVHLGEVLWASGQQQQAKNIWKKAWQANPNDLELINVLNQYQISF